jgi:hypothetical protein
MGEGARMMRVVAILDTMWDWRGQTSGAGYGQAPPFFRINPDNHSGKRLYKLVGENAQLLVTNSCKELATHSRQHGTPDPEWLAKNLAEIELNRDDSVPMDLLLICGSVAKGHIRRQRIQAGRSEGHGDTTPGRTDMDRGPDSTGGRGNTRLGAGG